MTKPVGPDWEGPDIQYRPSRNTLMLACYCGAYYLDDKPARKAHMVVFGHSPSPEPPREWSGLLREGS